MTADVTHQPGDQVQVIAPGLHAGRHAVVIGPLVQGGTRGWELDVDGHDGPLFFMPEEIQASNAG